ncbi:MAG: MlaE family lipid ABC transporter permease subunit [Proteobacteria bacterium]|nr:MlaE family lipid ABC transporter permease subunit [Pseudomonadota bacterium]MBU1741645.1 MlaE family lipid ABC transporter permease subunit [Pseudomonadota bacterium]
MPDQPSDAKMTIEHLPEGACRVRLGGHLSSDQAVLWARKWAAEEEIKRATRVEVDLSDITYLDTAGLALLLGWQREVLDRGGRFAFAGVAHESTGLFRLADVERLSRPVRMGLPPPDSLPVKVGALTIFHLVRLKDTLGFFGATMAALWQSVRQPHRIRWGDTMSYIERAGLDAMPIVCLISYLLGGIMAFMGAVQLQQFGAAIYVADLVGLAMIRELGPIMTAILVAGRSGSAFAGEIGAMKINEEVDALTTMGFNPVHFLVIPKLLALLVSLPLLVCFADLAGILGGMTVGVLMLNLTINTYVQHTVSMITLSMVLVSMLKSLVFALLVAWVGCLRGFQVEAGAESLSRGVTSAVVTSIFMVIFADSIFNVIQTM